MAMMMMMMMMMMTGIVAGTYDPQQAIDAIEEMVAKQEPLTKVLRLLCLFSLANNGLKPKVYDSMRWEILQVCVVCCLPSGAEGVGWVGGRLVTFPKGLRLPACSDAGCAGAHRSPPHDYDDGGDDHY